MARRLPHLRSALVPFPVRFANAGAEYGSTMNTSIQTTVGELIAALFDETQHLNWLKARERQLLVAFIVNDLVQSRSATRTVAPSQRRDRGGWIDNDGFVLSIRA